MCNNQALCCTSAKSNCETIKKNIYLANYLIEFHKILRDM